MPQYHVTIAAPWCLLLLVAVPLCWWWGYRSLAVLGPFRRVLALTLRTLVLTLIVLGLADLQLGRAPSRLTVLYLLDQSLSIPDELRRAMLAYVNAAVDAQRQGDDRAGVIVFGRDAAVEMPPFDEYVPLPSSIESPIDPEHTNLAAALKLAQASFPEDAARRIVLISDGNQTEGDAVSLARELAAAGIGIDVLPVRYARRAEIAVERVVLPGEIRRGQPFEMKIVLNNAAQPNASDPGQVSGRLILTRSTSQQTQALSSASMERLTLPPGKSVYSVRQQIDEPDFYTYEARFVPDRPDDDVLPQNNRATAFTHVRGRGQVLMIEDAQHRGQYEGLAARMRLQNREVVLRSSDQAFADLADLQPFDTVVLANVPRDALSEAQLEALVRNTQQLGAGLVMLGGANSFGAGGWTGTEIEQAMPVDFQVHNAKVVPAGALLMVLDKSGSMAGPKLELSKAAAIEAVKSLGRRDTVGVVAFDTQSYWVVPPQLVEDPAAIARRIARLAGNGGTNMGPAMTDGYRALHKLDAAIKHMIVLTDGITDGTGFPQLAAQMQSEGITVSGVAVGADADRKLMTDIARAGGGKAYNVSNPQAIPRIFQQEARRVARSLVYENRRGFLAQLPRAQADHEILRGLKRPLPAITGMVLTGKKSSPLVETLMTAAEPADDQVNTLLAVWTYGLGRTAAFTSDATTRWMADWTRGQDNQTYDRLFGQVLGWSLRPLGDPGRFQMAAEVSDGQIRLVVSALDSEERFLNFLGMSATAVGPDRKPHPIVMEQTASGRYVGRLAARQPGSYFLTVNPGPNAAPLRLGVTLPYSDEFRDRATNDALLGQLASVQLPGTPHGQVLPALESKASLKSLLAVNCFRHDLPPVRSLQPVWHYLVLAACCLLLGDVFVRRVQINVGWIMSVWRSVFARLLRKPAPAQAEYLDRLRSRKAEVAGRIEQLRAVSQRTLPAADKADTPAVSQVPPDAAVPATTPDDESYTARLLKAKKHAWKKKDDG